jgi:hypothetical protein
MDHYPLSVSESISQSLSQSSSKMPITITIAIPMRFRFLEEGQFAMSAELAAEHPPGI